MKATLHFLPPAAADMVRSQRLTGCRPGEVCSLRPCDIVIEGDVWEYQPATHKTEHRGRERIVYIGPKAQAVLRPYRLRPDWQYCFSPAESEAKQLDRLHESRKTPLSCGNVPGSNRKRKPTRTAGTHYTNDSYRRAIQRAVDTANGERQKWNAEHPRQPVELLENWSPNRLRHAAATAIRKEYGLEAAQVILGHAAADVTQVYAERHAEKARDVIRRIG